MLNRKQQPPRHIPDKIIISKAEDLILPNGVRLLSINAGSEDICRLELNFNAGSRYQNKPAVSRATLSMLTEGSKKFTSHQIAEKFDFYGSFCEQSSDRDYGKVSLFSLIKYLNESLNLLEEILKNPVFPERELKTYRIKGKQSLIVELEKVSTLARQDFFKGVFGRNHPYGVFVDPKDYENLQRDDLISFHHQYISSKLCTMVVTGKIDSKVIDEITRVFGSTNWGEQNITLPAIGNYELLNQRKFYSLKEDAVQSAIRIGRKLINRKHDDYQGLVVLNTILGGYFGSRLMKNIREDKGYTYGISSSILPLKEHCVFVIGTEVGSEFTIPALNEIYKEIKRLQEEPVSEEELDLVRNYLLGELLRSFDGAFAIADSITSLLEYNDLDYDFFDKTIQTIKTITPTELMNLANSYLRNDDLVECVAGKVSNIN